MTPWTSYVLMLVALSVSPAHSALKAVIDQNGHHLELSFAADGANIVVTNSDLALPSPPTSIGYTIHPGWTDLTHDPANRCSQASIGAQTSSGTMTRVGIDWTYRIASQSLDAFEGHTINLIGYGCASIMKTGDSIMAAAIFPETSGRTVYFRQPDEDNAKTFLTVQVTDTSKSMNGFMWKVTDSVTGCDNTQSFAGAPAFSNGGDFQSMFGAPPATTNSYSSVNVSIRGEPMQSIIGKLLLIYNSQNPSMSMCAEISALHAKTAVTMFSHQGASGYIKFTQASPFDVTHTMVDLSGLNNIAKGYHVHKFPVPVQTKKGEMLCDGSVVSGHFNPYNVDVNNNYPQPDTTTDDKYEVGDLSSKYGTMSGKIDLMANYTDFNLPLFGKNSIMGRSIVIHRDDSTNSRWICSNILPKNSPTVGVAVFTGPIIGHVYFSQASDSPASDIWIFARLSKFDGVAADPAPFQILMQRPEGGNFRATTTGCDFTLSSVQFADNKIGMFDINTDDYQETFYTVVNHKRITADTILNKPLVLWNAAKNNIIACAVIKNIHMPGLNMKADFSSGGLSGSMTFMQQPGYGQIPTKVTNSITGFNSNQHKLKIYSRPINTGNSPCSDLGVVYNPLDVAGTGNVKTHDMYKLGDLSRSQELMWNDLNLPLMGLTSINGRALVVMDSQNRMVACSNIEMVYPQIFNGNGQKLSAEVTFGAPLKGYIKLSQTLYPDGSWSDTSILVDLMNIDGTPTPNHNWHAHVTPVKGDSNATTSTCASTGGHYDPYMAKKDAAATKYGTECSMTNPLRCEVGDQAKKLGTYSLGSGRVLYTDVYLPLVGPSSVQGRSFVVHARDAAAPRIACADINPVSDVYVTVTFKAQDTDLMEVARTYAAAINVKSYDVVAMMKETKNQETTVNVFFLGLERDAHKTTFVNFLAKKENRESISKYKPLYDPNSASSVFMTTFVMVAILIFNIGVFQL